MNPLIHLAQTTLPTTQSITVPPETLPEWASLTSVGAVVLATMTLVQVFKEPIAGSKLGSWPILLVTCLIALALTTFARFGLGTLAGGFGALMWQTFVSIIVANGIYNIPSSLKSFREATGKTLLVVIAAGGLLAGAGCVGSRAELVAVRESMDQGTSTMRQQYSRWLDQLGPMTDATGEPIRDADGALVYRSREEIDKVSPAVQAAGRTALEQYQLNVDRSRKRDAEQGLFYFLKAPRTQPE